MRSSRDQEFDTFVIDASTWDAGTIDAAIIAYTSNITRLQRRKRFLEQLRSLDFEAVR
jgi:hypothetical protein